MGNLLGKVALINKTGEDMEIREFRGIPIDFERDDFFDVIQLKDGKPKKVDPMKYRQTSNTFGVSTLVIFCGGSYWTRETLCAQDLIESKTLTITKEPNEQDPNSAEAVMCRFVFTKEPLQCCFVSSKHDEILVVEAASKPQVSGSSSSK